MKPLKIAVIGGGSTYTPELIEGLITGELPVQEIALMDIDEPKLAIVGGLAQRMAAEAGTGVTVTLSTSLSSSLNGADFVITQLRVGGLAARILDERIPLSYGLVGQETTGAGGFANALRTIPVILEINSQMARLCPDALLINFTNPSGIISEALRLQGQGKFVGLCNYPLTLKTNAAKALNTHESDVELIYFGLNHLSWSRVLVAGQDRTGELIDLMLEKPNFAEISGYAFDADRLRTLGLIPSGYLRYYYDTEKFVRELQAATQTRGERVRDMEAELLQRYADPSLSEKPSELQQRGGAWYSTAAVRLIRDYLNFQEKIHVLNVANDGAMPFLPEDVIVEVPSKVADGEINAVNILAKPHFKIPSEVINLIQRVKMYELLTVEAALTGSRVTAYAALQAHPLLDGHHQTIAILLDRLLMEHQEYLPQFFI